MPEIPFQRPISQIPRSLTEQLIDLPSEARRTTMLSHLYTDIDQLLASKGIAVDRKLSCSRVKSLESI